MARSPSWYLSEKRGQPIYTELMNYGRELWVVSIVDDWVDVYKTPITEEETLQKDHPNFLGRRQMTGAESSFFFKDGGPAPEQHPVTKG